MKKSVLAVLAVGAMLITAGCELPEEPTSASGDTTEQLASSGHKAKKKKPSMTRGQENALESAESYLDSSSFSRSGLAHQLAFEKFTPAQVQYAVGKVY